MSTPMRSASSEAVVKKTIQETEKELVRLCIVAKYAEPKQIGEYLQTRPARDSEEMRSI